MQRPDLIEIRGLAISALTNETAEMNAHFVDWLAEIINPLGHAQPGGVKIDHLRLAHAAPAAGDLVREFTGHLGCAEIGKRIDVAAVPDGLQLRKLLASSAQEILDLGRGDVFNHRC